MRRTLLAAVTLALLQAAPRPARAQATDEDVGDLPAAPTTPGVELTPAGPSSPPSPGSVPSSSTPPPSANQVVTQPSITGLPPAAGPSAYEPEGSTSQPNAGIGQGPGALYEPENAVGGTGAPGAAMGTEAPPGAVGTETPALQAPTAPVNPAPAAPYQPPVETTPEAFPGSTTNPREAPIGGSGTSPESSQAPVQLQQQTFPGRTTNLPGAPLGPAGVTERAPSAATAPTGRVQRPASYEVREIAPGVTRIRARGAIVSGAPASAAATPTPRAAAPVTPSGASPTPASESAGAVPGSSAETLAAGPEVRAPAAAGSPATPRAPTGTTAQAATSGTRGAGQQPTNATPPRRAPTTEELARTERTDVQRLEAQTQAQDQARQQEIARNQERLATLERQQQETQARAQAIEASRQQRIAQFGQAVTFIDNAQLYAASGNGDVGSLLGSADQALAAAVSQAQQYGTEQEVARANAARKALADVQDRLSNGDLYLGRVLMVEAMDRARDALTTAQSHAYPLAPLGPAGGQASP